MFSGKPPLLQGSSCSAVPLTMGLQVHLWSWGQANCYDIPFPNLQGFTDIEELTSHSRNFYSVLILSRQAFV